MENTVFGVSTAEVEAQVRKLVEVYKTKGTTATLKEWGHDLNGTLYGRSALIAKFLKVLFEAKNDEFINRVLEEKEPPALWKSVVYPHLRAEDPSKWNTNLMLYMVDLAETWTVYNLPILQEVVDALETEPIENTPNQKLINKVTKSLENLGIPRGCPYRIGANHSVVARIDQNTREITIYVWDGTEHRPLTIEEVKVLEVTLEPVEEKYKQMKKAQAEMAKTMKQAGLEFSAYMNKKEDFCNV